MAEKTFYWDTMKVMAKVKKGIPRPGNWSTARHQTKGRRGPVHIGMEVFERDVTFLALGEFKLSSKCARRSRDIHDTLSHCLPCSLFHICPRRIRKQRASKANVDLLKKVQKQWSRVGGFPWRNATVLPCPGNFHESFGGKWMETMGIIFIAIGSFRDHQKPSQ